MTDSAVGAQPAAARAPSAAGSAAPPSPSEPELVQLLTPEGERVEHPTYSLDISDEELRGLYRDLVLVRRIDTEATALQRQGELGIWAQLLGQEAAQVGSGRALRPAGLRLPDLPRARRRLVPRASTRCNLLGLFRGVDHGGWDPNENNFHLYTIVIGAQTLHATGYAMGMQRDGVVGTGDPDRDAAVIAYFGDGATSQGDVNEAFIFAACYNAPVVFFCQNNQWAISEPIERQTRIPLYQRALGFGFPGVRVDGNDVLATYAVTKAALQRAREGRARRFVEAYTYRMGAHTTSDDPTRYRLSDELEPWKLKDPIERVKAYLERNGMADQAFFDARRGRGRRARGPRARGLPGDARPGAADDLRPRLRRGDPADRGGAGTASRPTSRPSTRAGRRHDRRSRWPRASTWACARRWRPTPRSWSWARTSASSAASSGSPTACRRTSARTGSSTPRSPSPASSAPRSAWRCAATGRSCEIQFDGFVYPALRPDRQPGREDALPLARARSRCRSSSASRSAAASARSSTTASRPRR